MLDSTAARNTARRSTGLYKPDRDPYNIFMRLNFIRSSRPWLRIVAAAVVCSACGPPSESPAVTPTPGVSVVAGDDGANSVTIEIGDDAVAVDGGVPGEGRPSPRFSIATGAVADDRSAGGSVRLTPSSRADLELGAGSRVVFESGFTLAGDGRRIVLLDLGRAATASDAAVWLPVERILVPGRVCTRDGLAITDESDTGAWIEALHRLRDLDPEVVVPWRGPPGGLELLNDQVDRLMAVRRWVDDGLPAGLTASEIASAVDAPWFVSWRDAEPERAGIAVEAVLAERGGLRTPWRLLEDRGLEEGPSPSRSDEGWTAPTKVLWRNRWPERLPLLARVAPGVEIVPFESPEDAMAEVADADAIVGTATPELLAAGRSLRWVQVGTAGVERYLRIPRLADGEVVLTNGQRLASEVIAEHAMALIRALARGLDRAVEAQIEGAWRRGEITDRGPLTSLRGKTLLVVGLGGIGTEVARLADGAGMRVTAIRSSRRSGPPFVAKVGLSEDLDGFLGEADVVVDCLPLTPETEGLFSSDRFDRMRDSAIFVNIGRGGTVDTDALVAALVEGRIAGAGLDVTDPEPLPSGHPLWSAPNLIITPHYAAWSDGEPELHWLLFRDNLRRFAAGEPLLSVVDPERGY